MVPGGSKRPPGWLSLGKRLNLSVSVLSSEKGNLYEPHFPSCWEKVIKSSKASRSCVMDIRARQQDTEWAQGPNPSFTVSETCDSDALPGPSACLNCGAEMLKLLPHELLNLHRAPTGGEAAGPVAGTQGAVGKPQPSPCYHRSRRSPRKTAVSPAGGIRGGRGYCSRRAPGGGCAMHST